MVEIDRYSNSGNSGTSENNGKPPNPNVKFGLSDRCQTSYIVLMSITGVAVLAGIVWSAVNFSYSR